MFLSNSYKSLFLTGSLILSSLALTTPAEAFSFNFSNRGFDDNAVDFSNSSGWEGIGDAYIDNSTGFSQVDPIEGSSQAIITTGRSGIVDDHNTAAGTFNLSNSDPITATSDSSAAALQEFLKLPTDALSIKRSGSADNDQLRTAKEGSAIYQDISVTFDEADIRAGNNSFELSFNWAYLSNDGVPDSRLGEQDFAFVTLFADPASTDSNVINSREITQLLDSSGGSISSLGSAETNFQDVNTTNYNSSNPSNNYTYTSDPVTSAGTYNYRVGLGVVDVDSYDRSSALVVDNFNVQQIPFEFSPGMGIMMALVVWGLNYFKQKFGT